jgi:hypothetical protein
LGEARETLVLLPSIASRQRGRWTAPNSFVPSPLELAPQVVHAVGINTHQFMYAAVQFSSVHALFFFLDIASLYKQFSYSFFLDQQYGC